jgi:hypothetical protein
MKALLILVALSIGIAATAAVAQSIGGMSGLGPVVSKASSGGGGGGGGCAAGAIDASAGCPLPMLGM